MKEKENLNQQKQLIEAELSTEVTKEDLEYAVSEGEGGIVLKKTAYLYRMEQNLSLSSF